MAYLQLRGIEKSFGEARVIKGVNLEIQQGEFIVFVGPSGCGKSTLLRLIAGLETTTAGTIHLEGRDITDEPSSKRDLAMVFQSYALYPHMSVYENMSFALKLAKADPAVIEEKVSKAAEILKRDHGIDAEVLDLRSIRPLDEQAILETVAKTHRVVLVEENKPFCGVDAQIASLIADQAFDELDAPIKRVLPTPVASAKHKDGKSRSKSVSVGNSACSAACMAASSSAERACESRKAGTDSSALCNRSKLTDCGSRRLKRPATVRTIFSRLMLHLPQTNRLERDSLLFCFCLPIPTL